VLPPPPPAPGPPSGVVAWTRKGPTFEPVSGPEEPTAPTEEHAPEAPAPEAPAPEAPAPEAKPPEPQAPSSDVAERLAAFGRRSAPPPGPPASTPPAITPGAPAGGRAEAVHAKAEARPEPEPAEKEAAFAEEKTVVETAGGERLGIVPSLAHRIAHPLYQLAAVVVVAVWLLEAYWNHSLRDTGQVGSAGLAHLAVATYGNGQILLIAVQIAVVAVICSLLAPTRVMPKGWFRNRKIARQFERDLKDELGVKMIFQKKWYLERMILAFVIWGIALAYFAMSIARKTSLSLQLGGYITTAALLIGFGCSAVLMLRRTPVVSVDESGKIRS
jgi:hypothetical protein